MKMIEPPRRLNSDERYPCSIKELRSKLMNYDIFIGIGLRRKYMFDSSCRKRPIINGVVIASISLNNRIRSNSPEGQFRVYPIDRSIYSEKEASYFNSVILDKMLLWYNMQIEDDMKNCVRCMIVEYYRGEFLIHCLHFQ